MPQIIEDRECATAILTGGEYLRRLYDIHQMMGDPSLLRGRYFGCANVKVAVNLRRIANHDFAAKLFREANG
jgi:hypothetical protein